MRVILFLVVFLFISFLARTFVSANDAIMPQELVVLELYTSQSCSSCPPADDLLSELALHENVIALGCHVTYWDHLSWRDTLSLPACTERQRNYNVFLDKGVFTPQLVVNGKVSVIGSNKNSVSKAIRQVALLQRISVNVVGEELDAEMPRLKSGDYFVTAFAKSPHHTQDIGRGENAGLTVSYTDPVTEILHLGPWDGNSKRFQAVFESFPTKVAVIVQDAKTAEIVAAGQSVNSSPRN